MIVDTTKRAVVLRYALNLESVASSVLAWLLDIADPQSSLSFGNRSSTLSFNQKLNLLIDNEAITKEEKNKLEIFSGVRNQFMHNSEANDYTYAISLLDGAENKLRKLYPKAFEGCEKEEAFEKVVEHLYVEGLRTLASFKGGMERKMKRGSEAKIYKEYYEKQSESIRKNFKELEEALQEINEPKIDKQNLLATIRLMKIEILSSPVIELKIFDKEDEADNEEVS